MAADGDPALQALLLPLQSGELHWPQAGGALFLNARSGWPLHQQALPGLVCEQPFKPEADALRQRLIDALSALSAGANRGNVVSIEDGQRENNG